MPRPDAPSVFGAILDRSAGTFRLGPAELFAPAGRRYIPGTNILETTWHTSTGWLVVRDALIVGPWSDDQRQRTYRRPPTDVVAEHVLVRELRCVNGTGRRPDELRARVRLRPDRRRLGVHELGLRRGGRSRRGGRPRAPIDDQHAPGARGTFGARDPTRWRKATATSSRCRGRTTSRRCTYEDAAACMRRTADFWRGWLNHGAFPDHPWRGILQRSALTLKGLTYAPTGALLAAATTSLPETPGGERNWDYRYSWVRDAAFALWGLYTLGFDYEANSFFYFIADQIGDGSPLKVLYARRRRGRPRASPRSTTSRATRTLVPCGSATTRTTRSSTTSGARCCTPCTCTRARASSSPA